MTAILALLVMSLLGYAVGLTDFSAFLGIKLQNFCQSLLPTSPYRAAYAAMVCGVDLPAGELKWSLQHTGLLHLFVVSGSHLVFLSLLLEKVTRRYSFVVLTAFAFLTGFNPPVARSLVAIALRHWNMRRKLFWCTFTEILFSGLVCLGLFPQWWSSLSFLLSWLAALGLALGSSGWQKALWIYVLLLWPMAGLGVSDPFSILLNWTLAPVLGLWLFPMSLAVWLYSPLTVVVDPVWEVFIFTLTELARWTSPLTRLAPTPQFLCWGLALSLHAAIYLRKINQRRRSLTL